MAVTVTVTIDPPELVSHLAAKHRNPRALMKVIGVLGMTTMSRRLQASYESGDNAYRTGRLNASFAVGHPDGHYSLERMAVEVGSNVPYAAQMNEGGTIRPKPPNKALAIPLPPSLKRRAAGGAGWPRDLDPAREHLTFVPILRGTVLGLLVDPKNEFGFGKDAALYLLMRSVTHKPKHFAKWDAKALDEAAELYGEWILRAGWATEDEAEG